MYGAGIVGAFQYELDEFVNVFGSIGEVFSSLQRVVQHGLQVAYAQGEALIVIGEVVLLQVVLVLAGLAAALLRNQLVDLPVHIVVRLLGVGAYAVGGAGRQHHIVRPELVHDALLQLCPVFLGCVGVFPDVRAVFARHGILDQQSHKAQLFIQNVKAAAFSDHALVLPIRPGRAACQCREHQHERQRHRACPPAYSFQFDHCFSPFRHACLAHVAILQYSTIL